MASDYAKYIEEMSQALATLGKGTPEVMQQFQALNKVVKVEEQNLKLTKEIQRLQEELETVKKFRDNLHRITSGQLSKEQKIVLEERKQMMISLFEQSILNSDTEYEALGPYLETFLMPLVKLESLFTSQ